MYEKLKLKHLRGVCVCMLSVEMRFGFLFAPKHNPQSVPGSSKYNDTILLLTKHIFKSTWMWMTSAFHALNIIYLIQFAHSKRCHFGLPLPGCNLTTCMRVLKSKLKKFESIMNKSLVFSYFSANGDDCLRSYRSYKKI